MPTARQLLIIACLSGVIALVVTLLLRLVGLGEHATIAAAVSASVAAVIAMGRMGCEREGKEEVASFFR